MKPKISFVMPVFNKEAYVGEVIPSVLNQSVKELELIVVDDCSTDDSRSIIEYYAKKDKRLKYFPLEKNMGRSYARNFGNSKAKAPIIAVQDADDLSAPNRAEKTLDYFKKNKVDLFYSGFYFGDTFGRTLQQIGTEAFDFNKVKETKMTYICHSTMAYKTSIIKKIQYSEGDFSRLGIDDWKFQIDCYQKGYKFGFIQEPLVVYIQTGNSISANRNEKEVLEVKDKVLAI